MKEEDKEKGSLFGIFEHPIRLEGVEELLTREIREFGGGASAHIVIPRKHIGKDAIITIKTTERFKAKRIAEEKLKKEENKKS